MQQRSKKRKEFIMPLSTLMRVRAIYSKKRNELANDAGVHYNTVQKVLSGTHYNQKVFEKILSNAGNNTDNNLRQNDVSALQKVVDAEKNFFQQNYDGSKAVGKEQTKSSSSSN